MAKRNAATKKAKNTPKAKIKAANRAAKTNAGTRKSVSRIEDAMTTSVLEGPMKPLIAEALLRRK